MKLSERDARMWLRGVFLVLAAGAAVALVCEPPVDQTFCRGIQIDCLWFTEENCTASGGRLIPNGGLCHACSLCVQYVGAGETCNVTAVEYGSVEGGVAVWSVCSCPLVCSHQYNGTCVREEECQYPATTTTTTTSSETTSTSP